MENSDQVTSLEVDIEVNVERTPGTMLRQAREAAGVSAREMADRLNWMPRYVTAIEKNHFDEMRGTAFVRGYLRAYGKMVGVAEQELMAAFEAMHKSEEPLTTNGSTDHQQPFAQRPMLGIVTGIVGAILVVLVFLWWQGGAEQSVATTIKAPELQSKAMPRPAAVQLQKTPLLVVEEVAAPEIAIEEIAVIKVDLEEASAELADGQPAETADAAQPIETVQADDIVAADDIVEVLPEQTELSGPLTSAVVSFSGALLQFSFSGDCWLEVRDGTDTLIYANLHRAGDDLGLDGQPPFNILTGDARYVQLHYGGEEIEIQSRPGRVLARFKVGE